jgi:hypothetical protein
MATINIKICHSQPHGCIVACCPSCAQDMEAAHNIFFVVVQMPFRGSWLLVDPCKSVVHAHRFAQAFNCNGPCKNFITLRELRLHACLHAAAVRISALQKRSA